MSITKVCQFWNFFILYSYLQAVGRILIQISFASSFTMTKNSDVLLLYISQDELMVQVIVATTSINDDTSSSPASGSEVVFWLCSD